jgi:hypothetical protein
MKSRAVLSIRSTLTDNCLHSIPRQEADEINRIVMQELNHIQKGCKSVIVGGYVIWLSLSH